MIALLAEQNEQNVTHLHGPLDAERFPSVSERGSTPSRCTSRRDWRRWWHRVGFSDSTVPDWAHKDGCCCPSKSLRVFSHIVPFKRTKLSQLLTKKWTKRKCTYFCVPSGPFSTKQQPLLKSEPLPDWAPVLCVFTAEAPPLSAQNWCFSGTTSLGQESGAGLSIVIFYKLYKLSGMRKTKQRW